ncbi:MAG: hypothetical protein LBC68_12215 [Prevotellaceae bacterium]|jgi:hypothetical protein|nr:hypothetical protein [Prevotellaceae bacterium]
MSIIKDFFYNLSWRCAKENDLSDITWTLCQASETFKLLFLNFFFPTVKFNKINCFERETTKDDSRADFFIENAGQIFVVECKIGDRNHHFEQYTKAYNIYKEHLGYIVNYNDFPRNGFEVKTWRQFYDFIENNMPENKEEKVIFEAYLEYLKNVCGITKITKKMELNNIYSLYCFNVILKSVIERTTDKFELSFYNTDFHESRYGYKFKVQSPNKIDIWLSIGLWFNSENPIIAVEVWNREGWGKPFADILAEGKKEYNGQYAKKNYKEDACYYFETSEKFNQEFKQTIDAEQQKELLCRFVDEVVEFYVNS